MVGRDGGEWATDGKCAPYTMRLHDEQKKQLL